MRAVTWFDQCLQSMFTIHRQLLRPTWPYMDADDMRKWRRMWAWSREWFCVFSHSHQKALPSPPNLSPAGVQLVLHLLEGRDAALRPASNPRRRLLHFPSHRDAGTAVFKPDTFWQKDSRPGLLGSLSAAFPRTLICCTGAQKTTKLPLQYLEHRVLWFKRTLI